MREGNGKGRKMIEEGEREVAKSKRGTEKLI